MVWGFQMFVTSFESSWNWVDPVDSEAIRDSVSDSIGWFLWSSWDLIDISERFPVALNLFLFLMVWGFSMSVTSF